MIESSPIEGTVPEELSGARLDVALAELFAEYSRSRLQHWIRSGQVKINDGVVLNTRQRVSGGERVLLHIPSETQVENCEPQNIPLNIHYEDAHIIVIDKPADLVMHPAAGNPDGTVQNALLYHYPELDQLPRAGIVHRLDKDTTGLFVVARSLPAHASLVSQLQTRTMGREYEAVVEGTLVAGGTIELPIGRDESNRKRMAVRDNGKYAKTHYRIIEKFPAHTHVTVRLETGRTHQIRVHFAHQRHPLVGDKLYAGRIKYAKGMDAFARERLHAFSRQALHARRLSLLHPDQQNKLVWESPLPDDINELIRLLRCNRQEQNQTQ